jgi:hypothetical protein
MFIKKLKTNVFNKWSVSSEEPNDIIGSYTGEIILHETAQQNTSYSKGYRRVTK